MIRRTAAVLLSLSLPSLATFAACTDDDSGAGAPYVTLQELDQTQQPATEALGVLVDVVARGGNAVRLDAVGGTFVGTSTSILCVAFPSSDASSVSSVVVGVLPGQTESLLTANLGSVGDAGAAPPVDATVDARGPDGSTGGAASIGAGAPASSPLVFFDPGCVSTDFVAEKPSVSIVVSVGRAPPPLSSGSPDASNASEAGADGGELGDGEAGEGDSGEGDAADARPGNDAAPSDAAGDVTDASGGNG